VEFEVWLARELAELPDVLAVALGEIVARAGLAGYAERLLHAVDTGGLQAAIAATTEHVEGLASI
jgi:hypothetical protein